MTEISQEYLTLFTAITDAAENLEQLRLRLLRVQQHAEELYIEEPDEFSHP